jgi:hypothetical protein
LGALEKAVQLGLVWKKHDASESPNVAETELPSISRRPTASDFQISYQVSMRQGRLLTRDHGQLPGHSQVKKKDNVLLETNHNPFSSPGQIHDSLAGQMRHPIETKRTAKSLLANPNPCDSKTQQARAQFPHNRFHLRKLRHGEFPLTLE